mmetsp:Transcript_3290/g.4076  ORF Transcript_3290/g.4076 Transcript_3290/m.4076 type:complete len:412 (+) Transcript_3290:84-1319(+)
MPPRKKKPTASGGGGGALSSLGGAFSRKGKKSKTKEVIKAMGGVVNTLGWLWKDRKPVPKVPPKEDADDDDDDDDDQIVRSLPPFIKLNLITPGSGSEFKKTQEYRNYAEFDISANLRVGEFRNRIMEFFGEWQELKPSQDDPNNGKQVKKVKKAGKKKGKDKSDAKPIKHKAPLPQRLVTGRKIWVDSTLIGDIVTFVGGGGGDGTGDGESMHAFLPWAGHGTELMRYGPVVIVLGDAELDVPPLEITEIPPPKPQRGPLGGPPSGSGRGSRPNTSNQSRPGTPASNMGGGGGGGDDEKVVKKTTPIVPAVRTAQTWYGSNGQAHLVPQKSVHLISYPVSTQIDNQKDKKNKKNNKNNKTVSVSKKKVSPDFEELTTSLKAHAPLGLDNAREDLQGVNLFDATLKKPPQQ